MSGQSPPGAVALVVLAAGAGRRMRSNLPKPLHPVAGLPMIEHVLRAGAGAHPLTTIVVVSPGLAALSDHLDQPGITTVIQDAPRGTGDAVRCALGSLGDARWILMLFADHPRLTGSVVQALVTKATHEDAKLTILTCFVDDAAAYGRIERDHLRRPIRIVERDDDDPSQRIGSVEVNSGMMVLDAAWAKDALDRLEPNAKKGEYYLTDLVEMVVGQPRSNDDPWPVATFSADTDVIHGINDRAELAAADNALRSRIRTRHMVNGVTIIAPETVVIDEDVTIEADTTILPFTVLTGRTRIGAGCRIGPHAVLADVQIGNDVIVQSSTISSSSIGHGADVGPYAHIRGGTRIGESVHVGNFAELKNAVLDQHVKVGHVSYLGDVHVGASTNIGAGTITCNFDGEAKHHTEIGDNVFIGSDTMLVAPVVIGNGARTGAGSVVTRDVGEGVTVVGIPARPIKRQSPPVADDRVAKPETEDGV